MSGKIKFNIREVYPKNTRYMNYAEFFLTVIDETDNDKICNFSPKIDEIAELLYAIILHEKKVDFVRDLREPYAQKAASRFTEHINRALDEPLKKEDIQQEYYKWNKKRD